jgi:raffinose/stachyose/melibiose transport system substrate-binding protein
LPPVFPNKQALRGFFLADCTRIFAGIQHISKLFRKIFVDSVLCVEKQSHIIKILGGKPNYFERRFFMKAKFMKAKSFLAASLALCLLLGTAACGAPIGTAAPDAPAGLTTITFPTYKSGENVAAPFMRELVQAFNETYAGTYQVVLEEVTGEIYPEKMKQMAQQHMLPVVLHMDVGGEFIDSVAIPEGWLYDFSGWFQTSGVKNVALESSVAYCTTPEGAMYVMPGVINNYIGLFYNSKLYSPAKPIGQMSLEEWLASLGGSKLALMTGENSWSTALLFSAVLANQPGGLEMLNKDYRKDDVAGDFCYDYNVPAFLESVRILQGLFQTNASDNAVGAAFADAANNFMSGKSALIFNGPWMNGQFAPADKENWSNGFDGADVKADIYPGNMALMGDITYGEYAVVAQGHSQAEIDAGLAFVDFIYSPQWLERALLEFGGVAPNFKPSPAFYAALEATPLLLQQQQSLNEDTTYYNAIFSIFPLSMEMVFSNLLTSLATGGITPEQFCQQMTLEALATRE